jgi:glycosyltransferase 2 family protein
VTWAPTDVLRLIVAAVLWLGVVVLGALFYSGITDFLADLLRGLDRLPEWFVTALAIVAELMILVLLFGGLVVAVWRREWRYLLTIGLALALSVVVFLIAQGILDEGTRQVTQLNEGLLPVDPADLPIGVAIVTGVVSAAAPWVGRRWRRAAWAMVVIITVVWFITSDIALDVIVALLSGWFGGALAVAALGAPSMRPSIEAIQAGLAAVGVELRELHRADVDARGSSPYFGTTVDGTPLFVKALGEDERSADLMFRTYRRIMPRDLGDEKADASLRRTVEHEALVALAVRDLGVRTPRFVAFAQADPNGFVLAYEQIAGKSFDRVPLEQMTDDALGGIWDQLALMRRHRVAHRDLRLANVFLGDDGQSWIIDFGFSELAASDLLLRTDVAELLASSTTVVGPERAIAVAASVVGPDALVDAASRLQLGMLSGATRTAMKASPGLLEDLRGRLEPAAVHRSA